MRIEWARRRLAVVGRLARTLPAAFLLVACGTPHMKPPIKPSSVWRVEGHKQRKNQRDRTLRVGPFAVDDVQGTPLAGANMTGYGKAPDRRSWEYRFDVRGGGRTLRGQCTEEVDQARWHGMGSMLLTLQCTCSEDGRTLASLGLQQERGTLTLGDEAYELTAAHLSALGESVRSVLGYRVTQGSREGGVELTGDARAYIPQALPEDQQPVFACAYAALLLFREAK